MATPAPHRSQSKRQNVMAKIKRQLPPVNFISLHYAYFVVVCLVMSVVFWKSGKKEIEYTDALFLVVSAMTEAGLNTVNLSEMNTAQQAMLFCLIIIGSSIFVSIATVLSRKWAIESRFEYFIKLQKEMKRDRRSRASDLAIAEEHGDKSEFESRHSEPRDPISRHGRGLVAAKQSQVGGERVGVDNDGEEDVDRISHLRYVPSRQSNPEIHLPRVLSFAGVGARPLSSSYRKKEGDGMSMRRHGSHGESMSEEMLDTTEYPSYLTRYTTGRNSQFFNLTRAEREHLGGVEYRAIKLLSYVVPSYFLFWHITGCMGLAAYFSQNKANVARNNGIDPWWLGFFNGASAFNNSGMSLLDANMIPFQKSVYPLMQMGIMILAGNTCYPIFLRFILWATLKITTLIFPDEDTHAEFKGTLSFILKYPRRVYTNLFPAPATRWLLFMVVLLNTIDWVAFELLNLDNPSVKSIPQGYRVLDGLFQALAVRAGGFYVISIPTLRIGLQVLYVIMMYISAYPIVITMRHSNVYEERSLGIYAGDPSMDSKDPDSVSLSSHPRRSFVSTSTHFIQQQISGQLTHDLWLITLAVFIISCIEGSNFDADPETFSVFNILFEVMSGYGCVGISTGMKGQAYSFSGGWHRASKVVLIGVMLRGRHRGLPVALDRAVQMPGGRLHEGMAEEEDAGLRRGIGEKVA